ncbi:MAG: LptA/OstA family protein [Bacillota bacterium]
MKNKLVILVIIVLSFSLRVPIQATSDNKEEEAKLTADRVKYKKKENLRIAIGNVVLDYKDNFVTSDKLEMHTEDNLLLFLGDVNLERPDEIISSEKLNFDLEKDQLEARENVTLDTTTGEEKIHLTSGYLKLWLATDNMLAEKDVYMEYDGQQIRGQKLDYNAETERMIITEQAEIKEDGEWIQSDKIVVDLESGSIDAQGQVQMEFELEE